MNKQIPTELLKLELRKLQIKVAEESRSNCLTFVKKLWPDFKRKDFNKIISNFSKVSRNFGAIK